MPSAPRNRNPAKVRLETNVSRPRGAATMAEAISLSAAAATYGDRAARRRAERNLRRVMRANLEKR